MPVSKIVTHLDATPFPPHGGLYGVMAYAVSQSRRELGLRMALGAAPLQLLKLVMANGLSLTMIGIVLGGGAGIDATLGIHAVQGEPAGPDRVRLGARRHDPGH